MQPESLTNAQVATLIKTTAELQTTLAANEKRQDERETRAEKRDEETKSLLKELVKAQTQLQISSAKQEERLISDREWQKKVEGHQDRQDERMDRADARIEKWKTEEFKPVRDGQRHNSLLVNGAVGSVGLILGIGTTIYFGG